LSAEIVVFGRIPMPGRVKTRLASALGPDVAAGIYRALLDYALGEARATELPVTLFLAEAPSRTDDWHVPAQVRTELQAKGDLGTRMHAAFESRFAAGAEAAVLIGSDLPGVSAEILRQAVAALRRVPLVVGPATDGGYWLVGQQAPGIDLFSGVPWSSSRTLDATRARVLDLEVPHEVLAPLRDLDTMADLEAVLADEDVDQALRRKLSTLLPGRPGRS
jgi:rSAM/selenodomain-associated transferase 1